MTDKEYSKKLYHIGVKKGNHVNTKVNPDGSISAIQFTDACNSLDGPLDIIEADPCEYTSDYAYSNDEPRSIKDILIEDVVVPATQAFLYDALMIGYEKLSNHVETNVVPKIREKTKKIVKNTQSIACSIIDGLAGKKPKALELVEPHSVCEITETHVMPSSVHLFESDAEEKQVRSIEEIEFLLNIMRTSAISLATCIRLLSNTVFADDGSDQEKRISIQQQLQQLSSENIFAQIDLLLDEKNHGLLDEPSRCLLAAFRDGFFLKDECKIPVARYLPSQESVDTSEHL